ncbi:hypothetical protein ABE545_24175 [Sphingobacterium faecium]|uniref:hypothetical protein n=1 Tax=Sphingobacterium faecium TaxID=34087 RepID=UPI00320A5DB9
MDIYLSRISKVTRFQKSEIKNAVDEHQHILVIGRDHSDTIEEKLVWEIAILSFDSFSDEIMNLSYNDAVPLLRGHDKILLFGFKWHSPDIMTNSWLEVYLSCEILRRKCRGKSLYIFA